jgi:hypothetical protein
MTKLGITVGILAIVFCLPAEAQTVSVMSLNQAGAQIVLQSAKESAQQRNAPSAIAVVDPAGDLLAFQRMDGVRPASGDLAIQKARTAARLQRPTAEIEDNIDQGRRSPVHLSPPCPLTDSQLLNSLTNSGLDAIGAPLVRLSLTKGMIAADFPGDPTGTRVGTIPTSWSAKKRASALAGEIAHTSRPDWDNVAKAILDAGNTIIWA